MAAGIRGLDFHDLIDLPGAYSPLVATANGLHANPEWYALLLAAAPAGRPAPSGHGAGRPRPHRRSVPGRRRGASAVLVNFDEHGSTPLLVRLQLPGRWAGGTILRLTAPSPYATSHVKLGGREVTASGAWSPRLPLPSVYDGRGSLALAMATRQRRAGHARARCPALSSAPRLMIQAMRSWWLALLVRSLPAGLRAVGARQPHGRRATNLRRRAGPRRAGLQPAALAPRLSAARRWDCRSSIRCSSGRSERGRVRAGR